MANKITQQDRDIAYAAEMRGKKPCSLIAAVETPENALALAGKSVLDEGCG